MQEKEVFLKKINKIMRIALKFSLFLILIFFSSVQAKDRPNENIINYFKTLNEFSSSFIQTEESNISEGRFFIKNKRIKIEYLSPTNIEIIISKNKGMYFNKDLKEVEYFNPKNSVGEIFFDVFFNNDFLNNVSIAEKEGGITLEKKILLNDINYKILILFEKIPLKIRKIKIKSKDYEVNLGIYNIDLHTKLDTNFFSMVNPLIN